MKISFVEIQNFRKLKACRIEFAAQETILVGANNSGKTSAMDIMILFLKKSRRSDIATTDFTLSNWQNINAIGEKWSGVDGSDTPDLALKPWLPHLPSLDVWLDADEADIHHVIHLLPTLHWTPGQKLGVRLILAPKDVETLYKEYRAAYQTARNAEPTTPPKGKRQLSLWPESMRDFLDRELHKHFEIKAYLLDPAKCDDPDNGAAKPQPIPDDSDPIDREPFGGLVKVDVISAQRGFSDPKSEDASQSGFAGLSTQLRQYFVKHLDPSESPDASDIDALQAIEDARAVFDAKLKKGFEPAIGELERLNYPGFSDPQISLTSKIRVVDGLDHKAAVQFNVCPEGDEGLALSLPEQYNGLGYQNLISMIFKLIRFRDEWTRVGKVAKKQISDDAIIEPLHIVLIEEPEAHLHAQVQQVFIKKAYKVLRNHPTLTGDQLTTQLVVSTHSPHIAHELAFTCLRYFRREPPTQKGTIPSATVINLSRTFGDSDETSKFAARYIKSTHCDLFFADAVILVEGSAERMLLPHFIRDKFPKLDQSYISILEIGGSHAHRLSPLLETLGLLSVIITDLDSIGESDSAKVFPERDKSYRTGNTTLKSWVPKKQSLDELLSCKDEDKLSKDKRIRVAYQCPIALTYTKESSKEEAIPYTFEDSLALTNIELFRNYPTPSGLLQKFKSALGTKTLSEAGKEMFKSLQSGSKAEMALELLYLTEPSKLEPPAYISEGLEWLQNSLSKKKLDLLATATAEVQNA